MPRKNPDEVIAELEAKLEAAKAKTGERRTARITKLNELIETAKGRELKASQKVLALEEERDALLAEDQVGIHTNTSQAPAFSGADA